MSFRVDHTRIELLPELEELARDEESSVRLAAFDTIINLMEMINAGEAPGCKVEHLHVPMKCFIVKVTLLLTLL